MTVEMDGARAAVARVAADYGAYFAEFFTQIVHEQCARFDVIAVPGAVYADGDAH